MLHGWSIPFSELDFRVQLKISKAVWNSFIKAMSFKSQWLTSEYKTNLKAYLDKERVKYQAEKGKDSLFIAKIDSIIADYESIAI